MKKSSVHLRRAIARMINMSFPSNYVTADHPIVYRHLNEPVPSNKEEAYKIVS